MMTVVFSAVILGSTIAWLYVLRDLFRMRDEERGRLLAHIETLENVYAAEREQYRLQISEMATRIQRPEVVWPRPQDFKMPEQEPDFDERVMAGTTDGTPTYFEGDGTPDGGVRD